MGHLVRRRSALLPLLGALFLVAACNDDPSGPERGYTIRVQSGDDQFAGFGQLLENPLQVVVENARTGAAEAGVTVRWSVVQGSGAVLGSATSSTDANGVAATTLRLGPADAAYRVRATVTDLVGSAATFDATAVSPAQVDSVVPAAADAGDTVRVFGSGFASTPGANTVLVAGFRAQVLDASATSLRVVVPACVPTRSADVRVNLGIVESNAVSLAVTAAPGEPLTMEVGQALYLGDANAAACLRLAPIAGARYLLLLQNATTSAGQELPWRLTGGASGLLAADQDGPRFVEAGSFDGSHPAPRRGTQEGLDLELRQLEDAAAFRRGAAMPQAAPPAAPVVEVGDRRDFWVFERAGEYERVTAVVRHISEHAILYEDVDAPAGGFQAGDFQQFGAVFDDPIYETLVSVFGQPSDVDDNDRIIILFTPVVNRMTPPGSGSAFVAGFFFGIDLLADQSRGNDAEIFYTLVPDPDGQFGNVRTFNHILQGVPPVMAHEFQHMIHFNQRVLMRDASLEHTWLSEGLAHAAEELVGDAYTARGDGDRAFDFRVQNFLRADAWMDNTAAVSLLGPAVPLAVRGASWLLLEYLRGHFGGDAFLTAVTQTTVSGAANLTARTGLAWGPLLSRWGLAVWADDAGIPNVDPVYSFPDVDLRAAFAATGFPLIPQALQWNDFGRTGALPSGASMYWILNAGLTPTGSLNVAVAGRHAPFGAADRPQLSVLRIQ